MPPASPPHAIRRGLQQGWKNLISRRHVMRAEIDRFFEAIGIPRPIIAESSSLIGALGCVRAGLGLAVMNPFPLLRTPPSGVIVRPLDPAPGYRTHFVLATETPLSPATRRFQQILKRLASDDPWSTPA